MVSLDSSETENCFNHWLSVCKCQQIREATVQRGKGKGKKKKKEKGRRKKEKRKKEEKKKARKEEKGRGGEGWGGKGRKHQPYFRYFTAVKEGGTISSENEYFECCRMSGFTITFHGKLYGKTLTFTQNLNYCTTPYL